jgi:hypothetical protein
MRYLLTALIGGAAGAFMTLAGLSFKDWQYWGIMACLVAMYIVGNLTKERTK